ncbi:hypothetical protein BX666DRAFT_1954199 [Dichotomocladium elegans]|nr:hypothetical protein BX666DRAFT_1954199 [Dichotomocladium elegans]
MNSSNYFFQRPSKYWTVSGALRAYGEARPGASAAELCDQIMEDLEAIQQKRTMSKRVQLFLEEFKDMQNFLEAHQPGSMEEVAVSQINIAVGSVGATYHHEVTQNITGASGPSQQTKRTSEGLAESSVLMKKAKSKCFQFVPPMVPSLSINKPRLPADDQNMLRNMIEIQINDQKRASVSSATYEKYMKNMDEESANACLRAMPEANAFLARALEQDLATLPAWLWSQSLKGTEKEKMLCRTIQLALTDFYANCCRPEPLPPLNERTAFIEHVIPVIKYYNAVYKRLHIQWAEKGFQSNRFIAICLPNEGQFPKKLVDGIRIGLDDRTERLIIESSGEEDDGHTMEDTLKIIECSIQCLKMDMSNHKYARFETFKRRRVLGLQYIGDKLSLLSIGVLDEKHWSCVLERSAVVPRAWRERRNWIKVFEMLLRMDALLSEQCILSDTLLDEHTSGAIPGEQTIRHIYGDP